MARHTDAGSSEVPCNNTCESRTPLKLQLPSLRVDGEDDVKIQSLVNAHTRALNGGKADSNGDCISNDQSLSERHNASGQRGLSRVEDVTVSIDLSQHGSSPQKRKLSRGEETRKWHEDRAHTLTYQLSSIALYVLLVLISPLLLSLTFLWTVMSFILSSIPLPIMAVSWSAVSLVIFFAGGCGVNDGFRTTSLDVLILSVIVPPAIAATAILSGRERGQTLPDNRELYDSFADDESTHSGGREEPRNTELWGRWRAKTWFAVAVVNIMFVIAKGAAVRKDVPGAWAGLLAAYAVGVTCVCASCMRLWRPTSTAQFVEAEIRLLRKEAVGHFCIRQSAGLHTLEIWGEKNPTRSSKKPVLVMLPGFGASASFFVLNTRKLAEDYRVLCVDWLGTGGSKRVPFRRKPGEDAEAYFVDAFEAWRIQENINSFILVGHSLGAVLCTSYTQRFPERVSHLVLASPCTPREWFNNNDKIPLMFRFMAFLWKKGLTPMAVVRWLGPLGPFFVRRAVRRRFTRGGRKEPTDLNLLAAITWHNFGMRGCGENMLSGVLQFGAKPHIPLETRMPETLTAPCIFIYGAGPDWMCAAKGQQIVKSLKAAGIPASLHFVKRAGHQLFLDEPEEASSVLRHALLTHQILSGSTSSSNINNSSNKQHKQQQHT